MKKFKFIITQLSILAVLSIFSLACSSSGGGGGGSGDGIYNTTWNVSAFEDGFLVDRGTVSIDGSGNLSGSMNNEGNIEGDVHADGTGAAWTTSGSSSASGAFDGVTGLGGGIWSDSAGWQGTWTAVRQ